MSDMWPATGDAHRVGPRTVSPVLAFVPWARRFDPMPAPAGLADDAPDDMPVSAPVIDPEAIALDGFARGFGEGRRTVELELVQERAAFQRLAAALQAARPEPPAALAILIGETVDRLVRQIVGEAGVDADLLRARAEGAAALISDEARPARMRLHPDDALRLADAELPLPVVADAALPPGSVVVECRDGWIEDGPQVALDRLRAELDRLAVPR